MTLHFQELEREHLIFRREYLAGVFGQEGIDVFRGSIENDTYVFITGEPRIVEQQARSGSERLTQLIAQPVERFP
jgi:hypothetical protein